MQLKYLRKQMAKSLEEIFINKYISIRGKEILLASLSKSLDKNYLWILYEGNNYHREEETNEDMLITNRDEKLRSLENHNLQDDIIIKQITLGSEVIKFTGSSGTSLYDANHQGLFRLYDFIKNGISLDKFDEVETSNLFITQYEVKDELLNIENMSMEDIEVIVEKSFKQQYIGKSFISKVGVKELNQKISYMDEKTGEEVDIYINEIYTYDPYEAIEKRLEELEDLDMRKSMLDNVFESLAIICPRGKHLAVLSYESSDDLQYDFYIKSFLDKEIQRNNSSSSIGFIGKPDKSVGKNGYKLRETVLQSIEKDFVGDMEIELFSKYILIPELKIKPV